MPGPTFGDFVRGPWRTACFDRCRPSTQKRMESALRTQLVPAFGTRPLNEIGRAEVRVWFDGYSRAAPAGANRAMDILRQAFNYAIELGYLERNPARGVKRNPRPTTTRFLSRAEVARVRAVLDSHRGRGSGAQQADIIRLLLLTGCRKGEIVALRWREVGAGVLRLADGKTGPRSVILSAEAQDILDRQLRTESPYVFPRPGDGSRPRSSELSLWRKVRRDADIDDARLHDLRHTFASHAVMARVPLPVVAHLLGHANFGMTLRYAHAGDREAEEAAERIGTAVADLLGLAG